MKHIKIVFLTLSRSGHHAIINWIASQCDGKVITYNNCMFGWEDKKLIPRGEINTYHKSSGKEETTFHLYSIEEFDIEDYKKYSFNEFDVDKFVIINRDPYNWLASITRGGGTGEIHAIADHINDRNETKPPTLELWKRLVKESLGDTNVIPHKIDINYNKWFSSENYRRTICKKFDLKFNDSRLQYVAREGGGSSFDSYRIENAQNMNVLDRWKYLLTLPHMATIFEDKELESLSKRYFNFRINSE